MSLYGRSTKLLKAIKELRLMLEEQNQRAAAANRIKAEAEARRAATQEHYRNIFGIPDWTIDVDPDPESPEWDAYYEAKTGKPSDPSAE
jgi:hypothetical protein